MSAPRAYPGLGGTVQHHGIVIDRDGDQDQANKIKVRDPARHGSGVSDDDLAYLTVQIPPTGGDQCITPTTPDVGSMVTALGTTGDPNMIVDAQAGSEVASGGGTPGNSGLIAAEYAGQSFAGGQNARNKPPNVKEQKEKGALIRKIEEQGEHYLDLLKGIPTHGAIAPLAGMKLPKVSNIPTAIQEFSSLINGGMMSQIQSMAMSVGGMLSKLSSSSDHMNTITKDMPPNIQQAFKSMVGLSQTVQVADAPGTITGTRVHEETFLTNAAGLIGQAKTISDLVHAMETMMYDTSLHGHDKLDDITIETETAFGNTQLIIRANGYMLHAKSNTTQNNESTFSNSMGNASSYPNVDSKALFGKAFETIMKMIKRLPTESQKDVKKTLEATNTEENPQQNDKFNKAVMGIKDMLPLSLDKFK